MTFSEWRVRKLMLTKTEIARMVGVTPALITMIENKKAPISTKLRRKISIHFGIEDARGLENG